MTCSYYFGFGSDRRSTASSAAAASTTSAAVGTVLQIHQRLVQLFPDLACTPQPSASTSATSHAASASASTSAAGGHARGAEALETLFDPLSGKLTALGRQQVAQGSVKLRVRDLLQVSSSAGLQNAATATSSSSSSSSSSSATSTAAMASSTLLTSVDDPLDLPLCAHECPPIAYLCIALSRYLNRLCHLPRSRRYLRVSFVVYLRHHLLGALFRRSSSSSSSCRALDNVAHSAEGDRDTDADTSSSSSSSSLLQVWQASFRFNFRVLATYRVFSLLMLLVLYVLFAMHQQPQQTSWPWSWATTLTLWALPFAYLVYRGSFPDYVIA